MATENKKNPNYRPRDAKGHYIKSGKTASKKQTADHKHNKASVLKAKKDAEKNDAAIKDGKVVMGLIAVRKPLPRPPAYLKINGVPFVDLRIHEDVVRCCANYRNRLNDYYNVNEELRKKVGNLTTEVQEANRKHNRASEHIERDAQDIRNLNRRISFFLIRTIAVSILSFIAGCFAASQLFCK